MVYAKRIAVSVIVVYGLAVLFVYFAQRSFMYFPNTAPADAGFEARHNMEIITLNVEGIGPMNSVYAPAIDGAPMILFFHGNGSSVYDRVQKFKSFQNWGAGFLAVEYPGYGGNPGKPNQKDIFKTALANYDWLSAQGYQPSQIVIHGHSLGTASAVYVAHERQGALLVLTAPFSSMSAMSKRRMPFFPTKFLVKDTYRSDLLMPEIDEFLLVIHGTDDGIIPHAEGEILYALHSGDKIFISIDDGRHYLWNTDTPRLINAAIKKYVPRQDRE